MRAARPGDRFRIGAHHMRGCTILIPEGEIDLGTRDALRDCLARCTGRVVIDLAGVLLLDASGIGVIVGQRNRLQALGGSLVLRDPIERVRTVLETVGLAQLMEDVPPKSW